MLKKSIVKLETLLTLAISHVKVIIEFLQGLTLLGRPQHPLLKKV